MREKALTGGANRWPRQGSKPREHPMFASRCVRVRPPSTPRSEFRAPHLPRRIHSQSYTITALPAIALPGGVQNFAPTCPGAGTQHNVDRDEPVICDYGPPAHFVDAVSPSRAISTHCRLVVKDTDPTQ